MHKSLPDHYPPTCPAPPVVLLSDPHLALSHMLHILFLISSPVFPIPSVSLPPLRHGTGDDPSCVAQVCVYEANVLECTGMKGRKEASKASISDQVSLHLCRSKVTLCLPPLFSPHHHTYCTIPLVTNIYTTMLAALHYLVTKSNRKERQENMGGKVGGRRWEAKSEGKRKNKKWVHLKNQEQRYATVEDLTEDPCNLM